MNLGTHIAKIYEFMGLYDIILGIALLFFPRFVFNLFTVPAQGSNPFVIVSGASLIAIGFLLISYKDEARVHKDIGYSSVFVRFSYAFILGINLIQIRYHPLFLIFAITDFLTGIVLLVTIIQADKVDTKVKSLQVEL